MLLHVVAVEVTCDACTDSATVVPDDVTWWVAMHRLPRLAKVHAHEVAPGKVRLKRGSGLER